MWGQFLDKASKGIILLVILVASFFILPFSALAEDVSGISSEEVDQYLQMSSKKSEALMHTLIQVLTDEMIKQYASSDSNARERAVPTILKRGVQVEALNYLLIDAPVNVSYKIINEGIDLARIAFASDVSVLIEELEKKSVEKAVEMGEEWLFRKQIRTTPGTIEVEYRDRKNKKQKALFQYVLVYKPISQNKGELAVRIYSSNEMDAPKSRGTASWGLPNDLKKPLPPFTVTINGIIEKSNYGAYSWDGDPNIKIRFPDHVPDLGFEPLSFWERNLIRPLKSRFREVEVIVARSGGKDVLKKLNQGGNSLKKGLMKVGSSIEQWANSAANTVKNATNKAWSGVKSGLSRVNPFGAYLAGTGSEDKDLSETDHGNYKPAVAEGDKTGNQESETKNQDKEEQGSQVVQDQEEDASDDKQQKQDESEKQEEEQKEQQQQQERSCIALNKTSKEDLQQITGIGPATAGKIIDFRSSGFFYAIKDLTKINGIGPVTVNNIKKQGLACIKTNKERPEKEEKEQKQEDQEVINECVALNNASNERLQQITGIGPVTAGKIIEFRQTNDIYTFDDLDQVYGIGPATISSIQEQGLACIKIEQQEQQQSQQQQEETDTCSVNINTASEEDLQKITGIGLVYAGRIADNRDFTSIDELTEVKGIGPVTLDKIIEQDCAYVEDSAGSGGSGGGYSGGGGGSTSNDDSDEGSSEVTTGSMVINEIMRNPEAVSDSKGEWFELYNATDDKVDLSGCLIKDKDNDSHTINSLTIATSGYAVLARSASSSEADYIYYSGFILANSDDEIILSCSGSEIDKVEYDQDFPFEAGASAVLSEPGLDNNQASNWCVSTSSYGQGDLGTPGAENDACPVNQKPNASFAFSPVSPKTGEEVTFDISASSDPDGDIVEYRWNFGGEIATSVTNTIAHTFSEAGTTTISLTVVDNQGETDSTSTIISVGSASNYDAPKVVINEIAWMGTASSSTATADEWIELYNNSSSSIDLRNWELVWESGSTTIKFSTSVDSNLEEMATTVIPAHGYYLLERTDDETIRDVVADLIYTGSLNNSGEKLELVNDENTTTDVVNCADGWFVEQGDKYLSMEKISPEKNGNKADNWLKNNTVITNGKGVEENDILGTPKQKNSVLHITAEEDHYLIHDLTGLQAMNNKLDAHYELARDINASSTRNWNNGKGFEPIGSYNNGWTGIFDGDHHIISNLHIDRPDEGDGKSNGVGLFGVVKGTGVVKNVGVIEVDVSGRKDAGALAGYNAGKISNSYSTGIVEATTDQAGGLVGELDGIVENSYSLATSTGLVGRVFGSTTITNSYYAGNGRLAGKIGETSTYGNPYTIESVGSFWDAQRSAQSGNDFGTAKWTSGMKHENTFTEAGWNFGGTWSISTGTYPYLKQSSWQPEATSFEDQGAGTSDHPYQINNEQDLQDMEIEKSAVYRLGSNVEMSEEFDPVGDYGSPFKGSLNGAGHVVKNLTISKPSKSGVGLFGKLEGKVKNLGLVQVDITGKDNAGALAGSHHGLISKSFTTGSVSGEGTVGALVGYSKGKIENSYSTAQGGNLVGKIAGTSTITNSYFAGNTGRLAGATDGYNYNCVNSFWDAQKSGKIEEGCGTPKWTSGMKHKSTFVEAGWDFDDIWSFSTSTYLYLQQGRQPDGSDFEDQGTGTINDPYLIGDIQDLQDVEIEKDAYYKLAQDIDASSANEGNGFNPIGEYRDAFTGYFDGNNHVVSNLSISSNKEKPVGLFGWLGPTGVIKNLGMVNADITGGRDAGALVGYSQGTTTQCYSTGSVTGTRWVGGLIGHLDGAQIRNSYSQASVSGGGEVGGLAGRGFGESSIVNSYSASNKRLLGVDEGSTECQNSFWNVRGVDQEEECGIPKETSIMKRESTFTEANWNFDNIWSISTDTYPYLQ